MGAESVPAVLLTGTTNAAAGRDREATAVGLREGIERSSVEHRVGQMRELAAQLEAAGLPVSEPVGGHAVDVQAGELLDHLAPAAFPGQSLVRVMSEEGGVRAVDLGGFAFPAADRSPSA